MDVGKHEGSGERPGKRLPGPRWSCIIWTGYRGMYGSSTNRPVEAWVSRRVELGPTWRVGWRSKWGAG